MFCMRETSVQAKTRRVLFQQRYSFLVHRSQGGPWKAPWCPDRSVKELTTKYASQPACLNAVSNSLESQQQVQYSTSTMSFNNSSICLNHLALRFPCSIASHQYDFQQLQGSGQSSVIFDALQAIEVRLSGLGPLLHDGLGRHLPRVFAQLYRTPMDVKPELNFKESSTSPKFVRQRRFQQKLSLLRGSVTHFRSPWNQWSAIVDIF